MNLMKARVQLRGSGWQGGSSSNVLSRADHNEGMSPEGRFVCRGSQGHTLSDELTAIQQRAKEDIERVAGTRGLGGVLLRLLASNQVVSNYIDELADKGRDERLMNLATSALNLVNRAVDNSELSEGIFEESTNLLSGFGLGGNSGGPSTPVNEHGNGGPGVPGNNEIDNIDWDDLEKESPPVATQELIDSDKLLARNMEAMFNEASTYPILMK
ncbi:uncharacterized protein [Triticum aestivum]|uniref:uncharacterized protein n=1 Tax=Triticum aestivum TaxID=4565 RepID=UPI001D030DC8|nr:uncharacterized protein LOC123148140 [Triticum aestivum]XP_044423441.1 uncharacterized protein LOC123148140 [Triticum aestivum]